MTAFDLETLLKGLLLLALGGVMIGAFWYRKDDLQKRYDGLLESVDEGDLDRRLLLAWGFHLVRVAWILSAMLPLTAGFYYISYLALKLLGLELNIAQTN